MRIALFLSLLLAVGCADAPDTPDAETADLPLASEIPDDLAALVSAAVETPLQNPAVDVHRVTLAPGETLAAHQGGERVVYALSDYTLRFETDGETDEDSFAQGDVHRHDAGVHAVENVGDNVGDTEARFLIFERRDAPLPTAAASGDTAVPTPGEGASDEILFDDAFAEVHRVTLQPGAQLPPHRGYARAIYALSGYTVEFTGEGDTREQTFQAGEAHYHDPGDHTVENAGDAEAEFLVVEFKR